MLRICRFRRNGTAPTVLSITCFLAFGVFSYAGSELEKARDTQDRASLERQIRVLQDVVQKSPNDAPAQYKLALAHSYLAEVALEIRDKNQAKASAETGIDAARKAVSLNPKHAEYHRILGTLCGQVIPANVLSGLKYGRCALDSVNKALEINPNFAAGFLSRGVGNYYLPKEFGGGVDLAIRDLQKAVQIDPKLADAHHWLGLALRKANKNSEARAEFQKALQLNPNRLWTKQQLEKTPQ